MTKEGMNYAPQGKCEKVVYEGEYIIAACGLDHGHIYGMCNGLTEAGAQIKWVYDKDINKAKEFCKVFPQAKIAESEEQVMNDNEVQLIACACIPNERADLGIRAMKSEKDCFLDKAAITTLEQLVRVKQAIKETGKRFFVYFSERLHVEAAVYAGQLIEQGAIGEVLQVTGFGPHRLSAHLRPDWFFKREQSGGILCDIGAHQLEQFLFFTGENDADIVAAHTANYNHPEYPGLDDYGDVIVRGKNGKLGYFKLDWFTPNGLSTWGDGRMFIQGTKGYIELRKYIDIGHSENGNNVFLVNDEGTFMYNVRGKVGYPFFAQMILDSINGTENAMTQEHILKASELSIKAQVNSVKVK